MAPETKSPEATKGRWPFSQFHHVHIVVPDIEAAGTYMQSIGLPIQDYGHQKRGKLKVLEGMSVEEFDELGYRFVDVGGVHVQFMSPGEMDSPHKRFIAAHGARVFSIGFVVEDVDTAEDEMRSRGLEVLIKGRHENGWGFTYFDTFETLGVNICIRQSPKAGHL